MSANFFVIWGDQTRPEKAEIDELSFVSMESAELHVNERRACGEKRRASIFECLESNDGKRWMKAS